MAVVLLWILYSFCFLIALIPYVGVFAQALVMYFVVWPAVSAFTGIGGSWVTTLMFWVAVVIGGVITLAFTLLLKEN